MFLFLKIIFNFRGYYMLFKKQNTPVTDFCSPVPTFISAALPGYLLNGWLDVPVVGLAMFSRIEVSASMFFIR